MINAGPPKCLTFFRIGCELCERGDIEAGQVLLERAREIATLSRSDPFMDGLVGRIDSSLEIYASAAVESTI